MKHFKLFTQKITTITKLALVSGALLFATPSQAELFKNQFLSFELPSTWACVMEGAEWVCQSKDPSKKLDSIIVFAAKYKGDQDSLDQYEKYLKSPKSYTSPQGKPVKSEYKSAATSNLGGHPWVDGLHFESELPGFYTRYVATIKEDIAVLVTFSVQKDKWMSLKPEIDGMVRTMSVFRNKNAGINALPAQGSLFDQSKAPALVAEPSSIGTPAQTNDSTLADGSQANKKKKRSDNSTMLLIIAVVAIVGFFLTRKKN